MIFFTSEVGRLDNDDSEKLERRSGDFIHFRSVPRFNLGP